MRKLKSILGLDRESISRDIQADAAFLLLLDFQEPTAARTFGQRRVDLHGARDICFPVDLQMATRRHSVAPHALQRIDESPSYDGVGGQSPGFRGHLVERR